MLYYEKICQKKVRERAAGDDCLPVSKTEGEYALQMLFAISELSLTACIRIKVILKEVTARSGGWGIAAALFVRLDGKQSEILSHQIQAWYRPGFKTVSIVAPN